MKRFFSIFCAAVFAWMLHSKDASAQTQTITVQGKGSTFVLNFLAGYTQDRGDALERAAQIWADILVSSVDIEVDVTFTALACSPSSGVLGSAGPNSIERDFPGAPLSNTWYVEAMANAISGVDQNGSSAEVRTFFNASLDDPAEESSCLTGRDWYYGTGTPPPGDISFFDVVLHELAHGLGFLSLANLQTGSLLAGLDDAYVVQLEDRSVGKTLSDANMTDAERQTAGTDDGDLIWTGSGVTSLSSFLSSGTVTGGEVLMYAPTTFRGGSSISHFDRRLSPNELMEPSYNLTTDRRLTRALFEDLGWTLFSEPPEITGQDTLTTTEDTPLELELSDFTVVDPDSNFPADFTLDVRGGTNYTVSGSTVTPSQDFNGEIHVPVTVNDGSSDSSVFTATVTVDPVNDAPVVTAQATVTTPEDTPRSIVPADLVFTDVDNDAGFAVLVEPGDFYTVASSTVTPALNYNGPLIVPVSVTDGDAESEVFELQVEVTPVNDPPVITAAASLQILEDQPLTVAPTALTVEDPDNTFPDDFTVEIDPGTNYLANGDTLTPSRDFNGTLAVSVRVRDGDLSSDPFTVPVEVVAVNDAPVVTGPASLTVAEDGQLPLTLSDLAVTDVDSMASDFTLRVLPGDNYTLAQTTVIPNPDYFGPLQVPVTVSDGIDGSAPFAIQVEVTPEPDPPEVVDQQTLTTLEDTPRVLTLDDLQVREPDGDPLTLTMESGENYTVENAAGTRTATITPAPDYFGTLQIPLAVSDGQFQSETFVADLEVEPVNDPPEVTGQRVLSTSSERALPVRAVDLVIDDPDNLFPDDFTVGVTDGEGYGTDGTSVQPDGGFRGRLTVPITVSDGDLESPPFELEVWVGDPAFDTPVVLEAEGLITPLSRLPVPESLGVLDGPVQVERVGPSWVRPGQRRVVWRERSGNDEALIAQTIRLRPIVSLSPDQTVSEGDPAAFQVWANGPSPDPVSIPFDVAGSAASTDHDLTAGTVRLDAETVSVEVPFDTVSDGGTEDDETIEVQMASGPNLQPDARHTTVITEGPISPRVRVSASAGGTPGLTVRRSDVIELRAAAPAGAELVWLLPDGAEVSGPSVRLNGTALDFELGVAPVWLQATEPTGLTSVRPVTVRVIDELPTLSPDEDADGDGLSDADEGWGDNDLDGLPNLQDAWELPHAMPLGLGEDPPAMAEADPGVRLELGELAVQARRPGAGLPSAEGLEGGPVVDLVATELSDAGRPVRLVVAWPEPFSGGADVLRIDGTSSAPFVSRDGDAIASAPGSDGACPPPFSTQFDPGLTPGHRCLRLTLADGGPNDPDGAADRTLQIRFGVEESLNPGLSAASGGCRCGPRPSAASQAASWLLAGLLLGLPVFRRRAMMARSRTGTGRSVR